MATAVHNVLNQSSAVFKEEFPYPQVVASALTVGVYNTSTKGREEITMLADSENVPYVRPKDLIIRVIGFFGTFYCFYLVPITATFKEAMAAGELSPDITRVYCYLPDYRNSPQGMHDLNLRPTIFKALTTCKQFIPRTYGELRRFSNIDSFAPPNEKAPEDEDDALFPLKPKANGVVPDTAPALEAGCPKADF
ncbi:hypothetical protein M422DRAFT_781753 [Sphaerobolus stellatus SS14]|uniref:Uncharacterized protein n=1 Tax=Sphaerobolus stellatus (strain SS14) TaxID=990650 RepID=A0A0C9U3I4_SPHS4|nr:hypothetical protein M422DRAFT_781753 [Sphaerobolus stellatus SS14]